MTINTSKCRSEQELLRKVIAMNPKAFDEITAGERGDLMWFGLALDESEVELVAGKIINRFPGMKEAAHKRELGAALNLLAKYYPEDFDFFPKTYTFPEDYERLQQDMEARRCAQYIVKPSAGSQGEGIYMISKFRELNSFGARSLEDLVVQEYLGSPLLINQKKFDLRFYAVVTGVNPLCAYVCDEGLARFCTEDYDSRSSTNCFAHLTNYSLNKRSAKFIHTDELSAPNEGSKQTLTSLWNRLQAQGLDVDTLQEDIRHVIAKTLVAAQSVLLTQHSVALKAANEHGVRCFQLIGVDILLDRHLKPWLLEINANPSLRIDFEEEVSPGITQSLPSPLDEHVKTIAVADAFRLLRLSPEELAGVERLRSYRRVLPDIFPATGELFCGIRRAFEALVPLRTPDAVTSAKFRTLGKWLPLMSADFDIIFKTICRKHSVNQLGLMAFIAALEIIAKKLTPTLDAKTAMEQLLTTVQVHLESA